MRDELPAELFDLALVRAFEEVITQPMMSSELNRLLLERTSGPMPRVERTPPRFEETRLALGNGQVR